MIDSSSEDVVERVQAITGGRGAYSALDPVGGDFTQLVRRCTDICSLLDPTWAVVGRASAVDGSAAAHARDGTTWEGPALRRTSGGNRCMVAGDSGSGGEGSLQLTDTPGPICLPPHSVMMGDRNSQLRWPFRCDFCTSASLQGSICA